jgi:hypothetical protein
VALDIAQLVESDGGEYKCRAYNKHGEAFSSIRLSIVGQVSILRTPLLVPKCLGQTFNHGMLDKIHAINLSNIA